ncbi:Hypothetical predicted protein [Mytilus galloprovincialis]|nr:Hypothetical predicted protein [Mytilus galloprovincialis]
MWFMIHILFLLFPTVDSKLKTECQLMFNQSNDDIKNLQKSAKLLTITVELTNTTRLPVSVGSDSDVFQPLQWKRVTGTHGKGLLQLMPIYEMLSLSLLSYETEKTSVTLKSNPEGCIQLSPKLNTNFFSEIIS